MRGRAGPGVCVALTLRAGPGAWVALTLLAGVALVSCVAPGVPDAELAAAPIAIHYRTETEARERAEALAEAPPPPGLGGPQVAGHHLGLRADVDALGRFFSEAFGARPAGWREGRLALLDPRLRTLRFVEGARRGAVPLAWSADRQRLLFSQPDPAGGDLQVYEWRRDAGGIRPVTRGPGLHPQACYAAAGRIAVVRVEAGGETPLSRIWISGPAGRRPFAPLAEGPADHSPACAPDGNAVAFARERPDGRSELWLAPLDAGPPRRLAPGAQPRFTEDGAWIVYAARRGGGSRLYRVRPDGRGRALLGRGARAESWPAPSPDGAHVVYVAAEEPPRRHLYVRRFDGSGDRILFADGDAEFPVW